MNIKISSKFKNISKKITAAFLAMLMFLPFIPPIDIFAATQPPVTNLSLQVGASTITTPYNLVFTWKRPDGVPPAAPPMDPITTDGGLAITYDLNFRNASRAHTGTFTASEMKAINTTEEYSDIGQPTPLQNLAFGVTSSNGLNLLPGSLYVYQIAPYHVHTNPSPVPSTIVTNTNGNEVIFLSDIEVKATGLGNTLQVSWSKPTFDSANLFTGYRIFYERGSDGVSFDDSNSNKYRDIPVGDLDIDANGNYTYSYDTNIDPLFLYAVKVEPLLGGTLNSEGVLAGAFMPRKAATKEVTIANKKYGFAYNPYTVEYRTNNVSVKPFLDGRETERDKLLLFWTSYAKSSIDILSIKLFESDKEDFNDARTLTELFAQNAKDNNQYITDRPTGRMYYKILVRYKYAIPNSGNPPEWGVGEIESNVYIYDPFAIDFTPQKPVIHSAERGEEKPTSVDLVWESLYRFPLIESEKPLVDAKGKFVDKDLVYDVWMTDDITNFDNLEFEKLFIEGNIDANNLDELLNGPDGKIPCYTMNLKSYTKKMPDGTFEIVPIEENKVYYYRVKVTRKSKEKEWADAFYASYLESSDPLLVEPLSMSKPPLRIRKDEDGNDMITKDSITIEWDVVWYELFDTVNKKWYAEAGVNPSGNIVFDKEITDEMRAAGKVLLLVSDKFDTREKVVKALNDLGAKKSDLIVFRKMDISESEPRLHVVDKEYLETEGGYEKYIKTLLDLEKSKDTTKEMINNIWKLIVPEKDPLSPTTRFYTVKTVDAEKAGPLLENTPYVMIFRPFISMEGDVADLKAHTPNYVLGTTLADRPELEIEPTVPFLIPVSQTDTTLTVKWEYVESLGYELAFSEIAADRETGGGTIIKGDDLMLNVEKKNEGGKKYMYFTVSNLFPDTVYYLWIRALHSTTTTTRYSKWSNAVLMKTDDIYPPKPPQGLGLASPESLDVINKAGNRDLKPIDYDYMVIEWLRDSKDIYKEGGTTVPTTPPPDAAEGDLTEILSNPNIQATLLVLFKDLVANKPYYVRAKTILTIRKVDKGEITSSYQYVVQLSRTSDFVEYVEAIVPLATDNADTGTEGRTKSKESEWTITYCFITSPSLGEFNSDKNDNMYPLPTEDYEVIYDSKTDTLTLRFRSTGKDVNGNNDNLVDQRFISKLIANRTFNYVIDVTSYNNKEVKNRNIELPYSIIKAFEERKINFTIRAGDFTVMLPHGFIKTNNVNAISDLGTSTRVHISLTGSPTDTPNLTKRGNLQATVQKLGIKVTTPKTNVALTNTALPLSISNKLKARTSVLDSNVGGYVFGRDDADWARQKIAYDNVSGIINYETTKLANYAAISIAPPAQTAPDVSAGQSMILVQSLMNIQDINYYFPESQTSSSQFNKLTAAIAKGSLDVAINSLLTEEEKTSLTKANLLMTESKTVTRENAVNALIKLYELKTKTKIKNITALEDSQFSDIASATATMQQSMLKAEDLGFFENDEFARPKDAITLSETLQMIDIIIQDSGM